ncbi:MAG: thioredoxin domain-containing protein [Anaerolineae bacterium]|nr:thioredoxin domain-containing protein [Anaerolineae bacterium]
MSENKTDSPDHRALRHRQRMRALVLTIIGAVSVVVVVTLAALAGSPRSPYDGIPQGLNAETGAISLGKWDEAAPPVIVEAAVDFTDIRSARLYRALRQLVEPYIRAGKVLLVEYPVLRNDSYTEDAVAAVEAVFCAYEQGSAWALNDALFSMWEQQFEAYGLIEAPPPQYATPGEIELAARQVQIDPDALLACMREGTYHAALDAGSTIGQDVGDDLPQIYIQGARFAASEPDFEALQVAIEAALQQE